MASLSVVDGHIAEEVVDLMLESDEEEVDRAKDLPSLEEVLQLLGAARGMT